MMDLETENQRLSDLKNLKNSLIRSDYKAIKYAEGLISPEEYEPIRQERESIREQIRKLEEEIPND